MGASRFVRYKKSYKNKIKKDETRHDQVESVLMFRLNKITEHIINEENEAEKVISEEKKLKLSEIMCHNPADNDHIEATAASYQYLKKMLEDLHLPKISPILKSVALDELEGRTIEKVTKYLNDITEILETVSNLMKFTSELWAKTEITSKKSESEDERNLVMSLIKKEADIIDCAIKIHRIDLDDARKFNRILNEARTDWSEILNENLRLIQELNHDLEKMDNMKKKEFRDNIKIPDDINSELILLKNDIQTNLKELQSSINGINKRVEEIDKKSFQIGHVISKIDRTINCLEVAYQHCINPYFAEKHDFNFNKNRIDLNSEKSIYQIVQSYTLDTSKKINMLCEKVDKYFQSMDKEIAFGNNQNRSELEAIDPLLKVAMCAMEAYGYKKTIKKDKSWRYTSIGRTVDKIVKIAIDSDLIQESDKWQFIETINTETEKETYPLIQRVDKNFNNFTKSLIRPTEFGEEIAERYLAKMPHKDLEKLKEVCKKAREETSNFWNKFKR